MKIKNKTIGTKAIKDSFKVGQIAAMMGPITLFEYSTVDSAACKSVWEKRIKKSTARIGPVDIAPTRPKEFSSACLPPALAARAPDKAKIKGVVKAPVVAPEASKPIAIAELSEKIAKIRIKA